MSRLLHHQSGDERYPFSLPDYPQPQPRLHQTQPLPPKARKEQMLCKSGTSCSKTDQPEVMRLKHQTGIPNPKPARVAQNGCSLTSDMILTQG